MASSPRPRRAIAATPVERPGQWESRTRCPHRPPPRPRPFWTTTQPQRGVASRLTAGFLFVTTGVVLASAVLGLSVASAIIARGTVVADPGDVATIRALTPLFALFGVIAAAHLVAGFGMAFGSRQAASLGIGLGAFNVVAGVVGLIVAATGSRNQADGVGHRDDLRRHGRRARRRGPRRRLEHAWPGRRGLNLGGASPAAAAAGSGADRRQRAAAQPRLRSMTPSPTRRRTSATSSAS